MKIFDILHLKNALENMPFFENELAYLSMAGSSEDIFRDRLAYYLSNKNHNSPVADWNIFYAKEVSLLKQKNPIDLAVLKSSGRIEDRITAIIEFKHFLSTQIIYGNEFIGKRRNTGIIKGVLRDINSRLQIREKLNDPKLLQFQVLIISHYNANNKYNNIIDRENIYTHEIARYYHIKGKTIELGLSRKSTELEDWYPININPAKDRMLAKIKDVLIEAFKEEEAFDVEVEVGILDKGNTHSYHYFNARTYFAILKVNLSY